MEKHCALIARHKEWKETQTLLVGSKLDGCEKNISVLNFARALPGFRQTWKFNTEMFFSHPSSLHMSVPICGLALIDVMMWEWKNIALQSFTHIMQTFVAAAITKAIVI